ncbi:hypothetical protein [Taklimakanibacter albus]|uniref:Uncharacterized protein n=1 Tax=Taklimakanibacter albus TaxID=2800327 RepID=A0ACC5RFW9_9HYPH|nr:hypothetical protein [Aestuariivirga sp. YIM B02566]MBK1871591.1 hypothetical protein [Aestuariivirga sp. YIM B02566]
MSTTTTTNPINQMLYVTPHYIVRRRLGGTYLLTNIKDGRTVVLNGEQAESFYVEAAHRTVATLEQCIERAMQ